VVLVQARVPVLAPILCPARRRAPVSTSALGPARLRRSAQRRRAQHRALQPPICRAPDRAIRQVRNQARRRCRSRDRAQQGRGLHQHRRSPRPRCRDQHQAIHFQCPSWHRYRGPYWDRPSTFHSPRTSALRSVLSDLRTQLQEALKEAATTSVGDPAYRSTRQRQS